MDEILVLVALAVIGLPLVITFFIFRGIRGLAQRLERIEAALGKTHQPQETVATAPLRPAPTPQVETALQPQPRPIARKPEVAPPVPTSPRPATGYRMTEAQLGQRVLLGVGVVILILGIGYFLQYSFQQGWVQPSMRVAMTYFAGAAMVAAGEMFRRRNLAAFGLPIIGAGIATLYFANYAAHQLYDLISPTPAFLLMILVTAFAGTLSVIYNNRWLALFGLVGGFVSPLLIATETPSAIGLFSYLAILNFAVIGLAFFKRWVVLNQAGWLATWMIFSLWFFSHYTAQLFWQVFPFYLLFFMTYALVPTIYAIRQNHGKAGREWLITVPNALIALGFGIAMVEDRFSTEATGLLTVGFAALFLIMAIWIQKRESKASAAFTLNLIKAIVFVGMTIPLLLEGPIVTSYWILLSAVLAWAALRLGNGWVYAGAVVVAVLAAGKFYLNDFSRIYSMDLYPRPMGDWSNDVIIRLLLLAGLIALPLVLAKTVRALPTQYRIQPSLWLTIACVQAFFAINMELRAYFFPYGSSAIAAALSVFWTLTSITLLMSGFRLRIKALRTCAIVLFGITIGKVLLFDMAQTETPYRILSSIVLGMLLIAASFLYFRFKHLLDKNEDA